MNRTCLCVSSMLGSTGNFFNAKLSKFKVSKRGGKPAILLNNLLTAYPDKKPMPLRLAVRLVVTLGKWSHERSKDLFTFINLKTG